MPFILMIPMMLAMMGVMGMGMMGGHDMGSHGGHEHAATPEPEGVAVTSDAWKLSVGGFFKPLYQFSDDVPNPTYNFNNAVSHHQFRIALAEIKLMGSYREKVQLTVMVDPSKELSQNKTITDSAGNTATVSQPRDDAKILQDLILGFKAIPYHELRLGQFKIPFGLEGAGANYKVPFADRAIVSRTLSNRRDLGLMVVGTPMKSFQYELGVFNGEGLNAADQGDFKDLGGRLIVKPMHGLSVAGSYYAGRIGTPAKSHDRVGSELRLERDRWFVQAEFLRGSNGPCGAGIGCHGAYGYAGVDVWKGSAATLQTLGRFEFFDPNRAAGSDIQFASTGALYLLIPDYRAKVGLNYTETEFQGGGPRRNNVVILAAHFAL